MEKEAYVINTIMEKEAYLINSIMEKEAYVINSIMEKEAVVTGMFVYNFVSVRVNLFLLQSRCIFVWTYPFGFVWFYGTSTILGYLMANPFYTYKQLHFKQFSFA